VNIVRDKFDNAASFIVEEHIRVHDLTVVPHPDHLKDAIAKELRHTWNEAVELCVQKAQTLAVIAGAG
jgi:hypothetical protein